MNLTTYYNYIDFQNKISTIVYSKKVDQSYFNVLETGRLLMVASCIVCFRNELRGNEIAKQWGLDWNKLSKWSVGVLGSGTSIKSFLLEAKPFSRMSEFFRTK